MYGDLLGLSPTGALKMCSTILLGANCEPMLGRIYHDL